MSKRKPRIPSYCCHATGQAYCRIGGKNVYLGRYNSPESRQRYHEAVSRWLEEQAGSSLPTEPRNPDLSVTEACVAYLAHAQVYYARDGQPGKQFGRVHRALSIVRDSFGFKPARDFGTLDLEAVRREMVRLGWTRGHVNSSVGCIKRAFRWLASRELIPTISYQSLLTLENLSRGRCGSIPEGRTVAPADEAHIEKILSVLRPVPADMVRFQLLTAARPGEVCLLRLSRIDRTNPRVWLYRPERHKMEHAGRTRIVLIGPRAREILERYIPRRCPVCLSEDRPRWLDWRGTTCGVCADRLDEPGIQGPFPLMATADPYLFSPAEALRDWHAELRSRRRSAVQPSQENRRKARPARKAGECYTANTYTQAVRRACRDAGIPDRVHAHQFRHNAATRIKEQFGWEVARIVLGHSSVSTTQIYVEEQLRSAIEAMARIG